MRLHYTLEFSISGTFSAATFLAATFVTDKCFIYFTLIKFG